MILLHVFSTLKYSLNETYLDAKNDSLSFQQEREEPTTSNLIDQQVAAILRALSFSHHHASLPGAEFVSPAGVTNESCSC